MFVRNMRTGRQDCYVPPGERSPAPKRFMIASQLNSIGEANVDTPFNSVYLSDSNGWFRTDVPADMKLYQLAVVGPAAGSDTDFAIIFINNNGPITVPQGENYNLDSRIDWPDDVGRLVIYITGARAFTIIAGDP